MIENIQKNIRGGICLLKKRLCFSSDMRQYLLSNANKEEQTLYSQIEKKIDKECTKVNSTIIPSKICVEINCKNFIEKTQKYCKKHLLSTIIALDFNNLYGSAFHFPLPINDYKQLTSTEIKNFQSIFDEITQKQEIHNIFSPNNNKGYIFTCDMTFDVSCQKKTLNFPIAVEHKVVNSDLLTEKQNVYYEKIYKHVFEDVKTMNFNYSRKKNYTCLALLLALYAKLGAQVKLTSGFSFTQHKIGKKYVFIGC